MITTTRIPIIKCRAGYYLRWYYNGWHYWNFYSGTLGYKTEGEKYRTTGIRTVELNSGPVSYTQIQAIRSVLNTKEVYLYTDGGWSEVRLDGGDVVVSRNKIDAFELEIKITIGSRNVSSTGYSVGKTIPIEVIVPPQPITSPAFENNVYVGKFNSIGTGEVRLFGIEKTISVVRNSTGKYSIFQYLGTTKYITLGVGEGNDPASLRSMTSITNNTHVVAVSDDSTLNDYAIRFFLNFGNMENTRIAVGEFNDAGTVITQLYGDPLTLGIDRPSTGIYDITHDIGHTNYIILGVSKSSTSFTASLRSMDLITANSVRVRVSDDATLNSIGQRFIFIWENV